MIIHNKITGTQRAKSKDFHEEVLCKLRSKGWISVNGRLEEEKKERIHISDKITITIVAWRTWILRDIGGIRGVRRAMWKTA